MSVASLPSPMCSAALQYARRGWAVFPCRERDETRVIGGAGGKERTFKAKAPYTGQGLKDATCDEQRILAWWKQYPNALIGLPMGVNGFFALDFDPRTDNGTGEVYTLERLKGDLETQMGCPLPQSVTSLTQSDGVHVYLRQPSGEPIRNRGNLPAHVDVRGLGGYVIAPPSVMVDTGARYRWLDRGDWRDDAAFADAPAALIEILRAPKARPAPSTERAPARSAPAGAAAEVDVDVRKYAMAALDGECRTIRSAPHGNHNPQFNISSLKIASLVAAGALDAGIARAAIEAACLSNPGSDSDREVMATINSGWTAGLASPRDLSEIAAASRSRRERAPSRSSRLSPPAPDTENGKPSSHPGGGGSVNDKMGSGGRSERELTQGCAILPQTDLGNLERFLKRYGRNFLYVDAWGWLAWDGTRWNRDMALALLGRAIQTTMRAIQEEAELVRSSGVPFPPEGGFPVDDEEDRDEDDDMFARSKSGQAQRKRKSVLWFLQRQQARQSDNPGERFDYIANVKSNGDIVLFSDKINAWGRTSESAGHINCIAGLAQSRLAARPEDFDADPLMLNVANGTLVFARGDAGATVELRQHRRRDRMTKIGTAEYLPDAASPRFDSFLADVQPDPEMRNFLDVWSGYGALGTADAQKMAVFYGQGSNGKGVWINTIAHILGDYAWAAAIETFIDQGKYRKGSDASPDLAALAGRRMVYANEPEEGSKFSDGLIKSMTSDEPLNVRELLKPPFQLLIGFNNTVSANHRPKIGTDHGIQRRVEIVPWDVIITDDKVDPMLKSKLKSEGSGILNRIVRGALAYLTSGLPRPEAVREATQAYQAENDILGQFVLLCIKRIEGQQIGSTALHDVFAAWQTWAQQLPASGKPWSPKYLAGQMEKKGFKKRKSSTVWWDDIALQFDRRDFVDENGRAVTRDLPAPRYPDGTVPTAKAASPSIFDDDDLPP
ncbi:phage/plasmid primase, P4 family [Sphingomonas sp. RB3P16]|uniref:phage/plasmid primase, P4 family n=1 Tax=Parasphingomonas frigoris TaxID=3096163 RepID=UPI002FCA187F